MIQTPMDTLQNHPVRKTGRQKLAFRDAVKDYVTALGYRCSVESGSFGARNLVIGDPDNAAYLITAHYDTPARMLIPNLITPCNLLTFLLYQAFVVMIMLCGMAACYGLILVATSNASLALTFSYIFLWLSIGLMLFGPANPSNANDNTSGVIAVLEIIRTLPEIHRDRVCFVLFDLEEAGLVGSASYRKAHKIATNSQIVLNLDCVGDGDEILFFPTKRLASDKERMLKLCKCVGRFGSKTIAVHHKGFAYYPSDQKNFPLGVGIAAFRRKRNIGLYCDKIHTARDTVLDESNVNLIRAALSSLITGTQEGEDGAHG